MMEKPSSGVALVETPTEGAEVALSGEGIIHSDAPPTCTIAVSSNTIHIPSAWEDYFSPTPLGRATALVQPEIASRRNIRGCAGSSTASPAYGPYTAMLRG